MDLFNLENTSVSGNPVVLEDCAKAPLQGLTVYGKSTQIHSTGAQLLDLSDLIGKTETKNGATYKINEDQSVTVSGTPTEYTSFYLKGISLKAGSYYFINNSNSDEIFIQLIGKGNMSKNFTLTEDMDAAVYVVFNVGENNTKAFNSTFKAMFNAGDTALPWEPYTGGKPSPSPDYPQEIRNAGDDGSIGVEVHGKNIFGGRYYYAMYSNGILFIDKDQKDKEVKFPYQPESETRGICKALKCQKGKTYVISVTNPNKNATIGMTEYENIENASVYTNNVGFAAMSNKTKQLYTAKSDGILVCGIAGTWTDGKTTLHECTESELLQVEEASEATSYEPYHNPQTLTLSAPNGLPGIMVTSGGNYTDENGQQWICDEVDFAGGVYRQRIKHVNIVFNKVASSATHSGYRHMAGDIQNMSREHTECLCNIATHSQNAAYGTEGVRASGAYNALVLYYENLTLDNVPADVAYILSDPIETPLTQSQIETYKSLRTYDGTTIIESPDSAGLSAVYGRKIYMANTTLKTRIILNNKTTDEWAQNGSFVGLKGEFLVDTVTRKIKIGDGATAYTDLEPVNLTPEEVQELIKNASHSHSNKSVLDATTASFTAELLEKLNGIAAGANKTVVDDALSNTSVNPVQNKAVKAALDGKVPTSRKVNGKALTGDITLSADDVKAIPSSQKGVANGVATLDANGHIPSNMLPSSVDEILEGYISDDAATFYKDAKKSSAYTAETSKIYVDLTSEKIYRWSGSKYTVISETIALGETSSTAYRGDRGKIAYDHSQSAHAPSNAERNIIVGIQKNGADIAPDGSRKVNITVPTKTSQITNDSGFITSGATTAKAKQLETARKIDGVGFDGTADITHFATCSTAAATQAKTASVAGFNLVTGARVTIKFTVTNTAANPTLNVNGTGAKAIKYRGAAIATGYLAANRVYEFVYDGTDYLFMGDINTDSNTTYTAGAGLSLSGNQFKHSNAVTAGTAKGDDSKTLGFGGTFTIPSVSYDSEGHITGKGSTTMTMPAAPTSVSGNAGSATKLANARIFSITGGATAAAVSFNGTANVDLNVTSLDAAKLTLASSDTLILDGSI